MIAHYLKVAFRNLWKYKTQHLIALVGVGVALLCFSICLYVVRYAFSMNHCFANYERIAELNIRDMKEGKVLNYTPATLAEELRLQKPDASKGSTAIRTIIFFRNLTILSFFIYHSASLFLSLVFQ